MSASRRILRTGLLLSVLIGLVLATTGCGYLKNLRDDAMDCGTLAVGYVPPVAPGDEEVKAIGLLPPALGAYVEVTEFLHLGALFKATGDLEWDRRGAGATIDVRRKIGIGPLHDVFIEQEPIVANAYKTRDNELDGWREHMAAMKDPVFGSPAKVLIYESQNKTLGYEIDPDAFVWRSLPWMSRGWQDWEMVSVEFAIPEPFILHSGFYFRAGFDLSQVVDLALSALCLDLYSDAAYNFAGEPKR